MASQTCDLCRHTGPCTQEVPGLGLMLYCHCLKNQKSSYIYKGHIFSFSTRLCKSHSQSQAAFLGPEKDLSVLSYTCEYSSPGTKRTLVTLPLEVTELIFHFDQVETSSQYLIFSISSCSSSLILSSKTKVRQDAEEEKDGQGWVAILRNGERKRFQTFPHTPLCNKQEGSGFHLPQVLTRSHSFFKFWFGFNP